MYAQDDCSLEHIRSSEYYPNQDLVMDDKKMDLPFPCLCGENALFLGKTSDGTIALSNFRIVVCYKDSFINIPLGLIEMIECRDIFFLHVYCKDSRIIRCTFSTNDACLEWYKRLSTALSVPKKLDLVFAFRFHAYCKEANYTNASSVGESPSTYQLFGDTVSYSFGREVERMGFNLKSAWKITYINEQYKFCPTYPKYNIVPKNINDDDLQKTASFRTSRRIPSVVWRDRRNGAILARCSQPEVGWLGWRSFEDEKLVQELSVACSSDPGTQNNLVHNSVVTNGNAVPNGSAHGGGAPPRQVLILDARSYTAAVANRAKGGGCECPEYYPNCEIQFMSLANIHTVRKSFQAIRTLCAGGSDQPNWYSVLENTRWLHHISGLMKAALTAVSAIDKDAMPVLVHCSDGWDRTPQILALAELMLDPYYRTVEGFQALVEREWIDFGHKFADRCGHGIHCEDSNERCPVFLQFLDCVHQLLKQFPCEFEYNETFLVKLVQHIYSLLFGTFLGNSSMEREESNVSKKTFSVWTFLKPDNWKYKNYLYLGSSTQVLRPSCHVRHLRLWSAVYLSNTAPLTDSGPDQTDGIMSRANASEAADKPEPPVSPPPPPPGLSKTRSCDDIVAELEHTSSLARTSSDPNIASTDSHLDVKYLLSQQQAEMDDAPGNNRRVEVNFAEDSVKFDNRTPSFDDLNGPPHFGLVENGNVTTPGLVENGDDDDDDVNVTRPLGLVENGETISSGSERCSVDENSATESDVEADRTLTLCTENGTSIADADEGRETANEKLMNGVCVSGEEDVDADDDDEESEPVCNGYGPSCRNNASNLCDNPSGGHLRSVESSTDTLTEDLVTMATTDALSGGDLLATVTTTTTAAVDRASSSGPAVNGTEDASAPPTTDERRRNYLSNVSTSTSDISDSHLRINLNEKFCFNGQSLKINDLTLNVAPPSAGSGCAGEVTRSSQTDAKRASSKGSTTGSESTNSTPYNSRTPNSSCPATPGADSSKQQAEPGFTPRPNLNFLARRIDMDGLTLQVDPIQVRLHQKEIEYQHRIAVLERHLQLAQMALHQYASQCNGNGRHDNKDELCSLAESNGSGELMSLGQCSGASDVSWETIEEKDANMTLWVPDHAVTHCAGCHQQFWMGRRRHHCRNCGRIFCSSCTDYNSSIPQQLLDYARVCRSCFRLLEANAQPSAAFLDVADNMIAAAEG